MSGGGHEGQGGFQHVQVTPEVHGQHRQPVLLGALGEERRSGDAGDVDDGVEPAVLVDQLVEQTTDRLCVGDGDRGGPGRATRRHDAGTAIGIDVLRSQVELKQRQQQLVAVTNQFEKDKLGLARLIGLPIGQDFTVTDPSPSVPIDVASVKDALAQAYDHRADFQAAKARVIAAQFSVRAAKAERYPTLTASGFYGDEGLRLTSNSHGVFNATGSINFNIFDSGRIKADVLENNAELTNRRNELENLRGQIDYEVRAALLDLTAAAAQVEVAKSNTQLAAESLRQSRDRFTAGVTNTVEIVQAQQAVAVADENLINAQFQYNVAKVSLARAVGLADEGVRGYFAK